MTTTAVIVATTSASTAVTGSIADGASKTFGCTGLKDTEKVTIEQSDSAGTGYNPIRFLHESGKDFTAELNSARTVIKVNGPMDYRINKDATTLSVEVVEYS